MVSRGRSGRGRVSRVRIGSVAKRLSLGVWYLAPIDQGGGIVALSVSLKEEWVGCGLWIGWFEYERCAYS